MAINLVVDRDLACVNLAKDTGEKVLNQIHPNLVSHYAVKFLAQERKIIFQKIKRNIFGLVGGLENTIIEISLDEVADFREKPFILGFGYNIFMPRYQITLKSGQVFHSCIYRKQGLWCNKAFSDDSRNALVTELSKFKKTN